jgi:hypothetical protein
MEVLMTAEGAGVTTSLSIYGKEHEEKKHTPKNYIHNHVMFYRGGKGGKLVGIDPRSVFCGDLGF